MIKQVLGESPGKHCRTSFHMYKATDKSSL